MPPPVPASAFDAAPAAARALSVLRADRRRRTWSMIVTIMGDLTRGDGAALPGARLRAILARLDVSDQAVRTALHRLRADGWIETERRGRTSVHQLSATALAQTRAVAPRVYGPAPPRPERWALVTARTVPDGAWTLEPGLHLKAGGLSGHDGLEGGTLRLSAVHRATLWPPALVAEAAALRDRLHAAALPACAAIGADMGAALRTLIVHDWRRIVLRAPDLPDALAPAAWCGASLRGDVQTALARLSPTGT